jgi:ABC-2 type transport system permease protein
VVVEGPVAGFGQVEMARYFAGTLIVRQLTGAWIFWQLNWEIRTGALSPKLLRPIHPLVHEAVGIVVAVPWRIVVLTPLIGGLVWWKPELVAWPGLDAMALFLVSVLLAWMLSFLVQAILGMFAFWLDQTDGLFGVYFAIWSLLSGYVAPLAVFPDAWRALLRYLPFRPMLATPVEILGGFMTPREALPDVGIQAAWVVALVLLAIFVWKKGVARYGAYGA